MYPTKDENEKQQIEQVFGLTGGELNDEPLRYMEISRDPGIPRLAAKYGEKYAPRIYFKRRWARYFYDGVPEYVAREYARFGGDYLTIVTCELFSQMPRKIRARGREWIKVRSFRSSGEAACPGCTLHECMGHEDHPTTAESGHEISVVIEEEAKDGECPLCGEDVGSAHGYIYLGEGWSEVVYLARGSR